MDRPASPIALAVVIPAGPNDDLEDTLESVLHFTTPPRSIVVVDDTHRPSTAGVVAMSPDIEVIPAVSARSGLQGELWYNLAAGIAHAVRHLHFEVLLRLDADALVIGPGLARLAADRFASDPGLGMLGSHRLGMDGGNRDWSWPAAALERECSLLGLRRPRTRAALRGLRSEALANGYIAGEHPLGAACLFSAAAVGELDRRGWLELASLQHSGLGEDHLFGLMVRAAGFRVGEFAGPDDPLALDWKQLPASPDELVARHKVVIHSVRHWQDMGEHEIRGYFAAARAAAAGTVPDGPNAR